MAAMRDFGIVVALHEPEHPLTPSLSPNGGEGARRAGEGVVQGLKARTVSGGFSPRPSPASAGGEGDGTEWPLYCRGERNVSRKRDKS
jgi:hypothetical protein